MASGRRIVGVDVLGDPFGSGGEQGAGVRQHQGVVVDVDDPRLGDDALGDLVGVVGGRQTGADVQELADARLTGQVGHGADEEAPRGAGHVHDAGKGLAVLVPGDPVDLVVVLAAQPVVPDPGRVRHARVDGGAVGGRGVGHGGSCSCARRGPA